MQSPPSDVGPTCFWLELSGRRIVLSDGITLIGRSAGCQIVLDDALVSRRHAQLTVKRGEIRLEDLGSSNGVRVNGRRIEGSVRLKPGDEIKIGQQMLLLQAGREPSRRDKSSRFAAKTLTGVEAAELLGKGNEEFEGESTQEARALVLLGGVADKVLALGRGGEAERVLSKFLLNLIKQTREGTIPDEETTSKAVQYAVRLASATGKGEWVDYCFELYGGLAKPLPAGVVDELYTVLRNVGGVDRAVLSGYVEILRENAHTFGPAERFLTQRIEGLERLAALK
jgi:pSer/pThr/pTyr-binding forkhead associated (FHA) protein